MGSISTSLKPAMLAAAAAQATANTGVANAAAALDTANLKVGKDCGVGAVGSFCVSDGVAGSLGGVYTGAALAVYSNGFFGFFVYPFSGSWRCLGLVSYGSGYAGLFQRIA